MYLSFNLSVQLTYNIWFTSTLYVSGWPFMPLIYAFSMFDYLFIRRIELFYSSQNEPVMTDPTKVNIPKWRYNEWSIDPVFGLQRVADHLQTLQIFCRSVVRLFSSAVLKSGRVFKLNVCSRLKTDSADDKLVCSWSVFVKTDLLQICCRSARFVRVCVKSDKMLTWLLTSIGKTRLKLTLFS